MAINAIGQYWKYVNFKTEVDGQQINIKALEPLYHLKILDLNGPIVILIRSGDRMDESMPDHVLVFNLCQIIIY